MSVWRKLGEIAEFVNGRAFKPDEWEESGVPIIRIQNLNDESKSFNYTTKKLPDTFKVNTGDILFSWSGTPGTSFGCFRWSRETGWLNQHIFNVKFKNDNIFSEYFIRSVNSQLGKIIDQAHGGVGLKHITKKKLLEIEIPLPSLPEQKRIAAILDAADALRNQRRQSITELDLLLQSTFLEMFGDPVENPKGWEMCKLEVIANKITDGTHKTPIYTESGIEFLSAKDIKNSKVQWGTGKFISQEEHNQLIKRCNPEMGDVLMAKSGSLGAVAIIDKNHEFSLFESLCLIKSRKELIDANFLLAMLSNTSMQKHLLEKNKGVAIKHLHLVDIRNLIILLPSLNEQQHFVSFSKAIERQKTRLQAHLAELDTLFASLQQRAFNGEL